ncbi:MULTISPECIES: DoxX family protein [unclassified Mycobacterium]|uniref:DoxX family protein n=1 Tax=unclassified Mycobacterium TaxID=2642494 RepID=UPI00073FCCC8|nr:MULTISPECIES: DoxX family protein [unclassified Mycobacterium]KUH86346.1 DoxX family protein [Mycobacterium sp. IS-1556]KUH86728.1 DoxX family protein [Mycobacterium sp. GA-0227b]KUH92007.1 DoxX family protein [Mycobacterium sp. GA-1999]
MTTTDVATTTTRDTAVDLGLLILRIGIGAAILQAGLIKAFDFNTAVGFMESAGWRLPGLAALMVTTAETLGGLGLIAGALTPLAAFAVIAAMVDAWAVNVSAMAFWSEPFNAPFLIGIGATALLFLGAGAYSVDAKVLGRTLWGTRIAVGLLIAALAAAVLTWVALLGTNPIHFTAPS